jgi:DNA-binding transcriptional LysR family regulator
VEIRHLLTFKAVAETGGFTRAAELLGYAQSSITAQIQTLEVELGAPLFNRLGKKVVLTEAGQRLLPYAQEMLRLHDTAKEITKPEDSPSGRLVIGAPESLAAFRLPAVIQEYRRKFPKVHIILKPGLCWELRSFIRNGELDMAFLLEQESHSPDLHIETLVQEKMSVVAPIDHPLLRLPKVSPEHLKDETILQTEPGCSYRALFEKYLHDHGIYPNPDLEFWSIEAIKNCVMCGLGIALLPAITVQSELQDGKLAALAWDDRSHRVATQLIYHKSKWVSPALEAFLFVVRKHAAEWQN